VIDRLIEQISPITQVISRPTSTCRMVSDVTDKCSLTAFQWPTTFTTVPSITTITQGAVTSP